MVEPRLHNSASIVTDMFCKECGWPIVHVCCNDGMSEQEPYAHNDYWAYCSNKTCINHAGETWEQGDPNFTFRIYYEYPPKDAVLVRIKDQQVYISKADIESLNGK